MRAREIGIEQVTSRRDVINDGDRPRGNSREENFNFKS